MTAPRVYRAIAAVSAEIARMGVAKRTINTDDGYLFRGIDKIVSAVSPLLAKHKLCVLPEIAERHCSERRVEGKPAQWVAVHGTFVFVAAFDGSRHSVKTFGEACDTSDKATSKAMTAAFKAALVQTFCIPVRGILDADSTSPRPVSDMSPPVQGWSAFADDLIAVIERCASADAVRQLLTTYAGQLRALASADQTTYNKIGLAARQRTATFTHKSNATDSASALQDAIMPSRSVAETDQPSGVSNVA